MKNLKLKQASSNVLIKIVYTLCLFPLILISTPITSRVLFEISKIGLFRSIIEALIVLPIAFGIIIVIPLLVSAQIILALPYLVYKLTNNPQFKGKDYSWYRFVSSIFLIVLVSLSYSEFWRVFEANKVSHTTDFNSLILYSSIFITTSFVFFYYSDAK